MKRFAVLPAVLAAGPALAQVASPGSVMQTLDIASDHQPLYPIFYNLIYIGVALAAVFLVYVLVRSLRDKTYLQ